jgi:hypothetical protein
MSEPATAGAGVVIYVGTVSLAGKLVGMDVDAVWAALAGVLFALAFTEHQLPLKRLVIWLITTVMIAAWLAPVVSAWIVFQAEYLASVAEALRLACAFLIAYGAKSLIPAVVGRAARTIDGGTPQ